MGQKIFNLSLADAEDRAYLTEVAREMGYRSTNSWMRSVLNGYFKLMGRRTLKRLYSCYKGAKRPTCRKGHPFTPENELIRKRGKLPPMRLCRICHRATQKRGWEKNGDKHNERRRKKRADIRASSYLRDQGWSPDHP